MPLQYLAALNALISAAPSNSPFTRLPVLTFSYGRTLDGDAMKYWVKGDEEGMKTAIIKWSKTCWHAARGEAM